MDREPVYLGIQRKNEVIDLVPGDATKAVFNFTVDVTPGLDFSGPFVHGSKGKKFLYLSWGELSDSGKFSMFRRATLFLSEINQKDLKAALSASGFTRIEAKIDLTDDKGGPLCARVASSKINWQVQVGQDKSRKVPYHL